MSMTLRTSRALMFTWPPHKCLKQAHSCSGARRQTAVNLLVMRCHGCRKPSKQTRALLSSHFHRRFGAHNNSRKLAVPPFYHRSIRVFVRDKSALSRFKSPQTLKPSSQQSQEARSIESREVRKARGRVPCAWLGVTLQLTHVDR